MVNAQDWLDKNYPESDRESFTSLDFQAKKLKGDLNLKGFVNVKSLNLQTNLLTTVDIRDLEKLEKFFGSNNLLTSMDFSAQNPKLLREIYLSNNNFYPCDLNFFSEFANLQCLYIGTDRRKKGYEKGIYNRFFGSLSCLKHFKKLEELDIDNTDIDSGLEDLPLVKLSHFFCSSGREGAKVEIIRNTLFLSEEVAKDSRVSENRYKIEKINFFQTAHELLVKKEFNLSIKQSRIKPTYLQSLLNVQQEVHHLQHLKENHFLSALVDPVLRDKCQSLRKIKQEIVINREEYEEELTWRKIDSVCKSQVDLLNKQLYLTRKKREIKENLILFGVIKKEVESGLENVFLKTKKEIKQLKEIEGIESIFLSEGFNEEWDDCNCHCRISVVSALHYHLKYHLTKKKDILEFRKNLLEFINSFGEESKKRELGEVNQSDQQEVQLEFQIQVNDLPRKRIRY